MKRLLLLFSILLLSSFSMATHIVGGSLTYEHLGGTTYSVKLKLYRDCAPGNAVFPSDAPVEVRLGTGSSTSLNFTMPRMGIINLNPPLDSCAVDPGICVQEAVFTSIVSLPPSTSGYHLYWSTCCRNNSLSNVNSPGSAGELFHTYIPNNMEWLTNSSPNWVNFPPVFVCQGVDVNFDHSATDANGDSLVYSLYTPYDDNIPTYNTNVIPNNIVFTPINWAGGFNVNNVLGNTLHPITVNPQTGLLSGTPLMIGQYVVGVRCEEYRNGVKIGEIVRDFQFNVVDCPPAKDAGIGPVTGCSGNTIQMINASAAGASDFQWNFGDGSPSVVGFEPSHTFPPGEGSYTLTLIAQHGTVCADTATRVLTIGNVTAAMPDLDSTCINSSVNFSESSTSSANMTINSWKWNFGDGTPISTVPNPSHVFNASGDLNVKLIVGTNAGCLDSIVKTIYVQGLPVADVGPDTTACFNNPNIILNGIITNADGGIWVGNGGTFTPNTTTLNASYDPSPLEINAGYTELILSTTGNGFCPSAQSTLRIDFIDGPTVNAGPDIEVCADIGTVQLGATFQYAGGVEWYTTTGTGSFNNSLTANAQYTPSPADIAADSVQLIVHTVINGNCFDASDTLWVKFYDPPTISLDYINTICANNPIHLNANSTTGSGIWSTSGDGTFENDTANVTFYNHGSSDLAFGTVQIYFETINNGGCHTQHDTINITILPSPQVDFSFTEVCYGTATDFTSSITTTDPITSYSWSTNGSEFSNIENPSFTMPNVDTNDVVFIAYSQNGCSDTVTKPVMTFYLPTVNFITPAPCLNGGTQYYDSSYVVGGYTDTWEWKFGDGATSTDQNPLHFYGSATNYDVTLIVSSTEGCVDSITKPTTIYTGPVASFTSSPSSAYVNQNINFVDHSTSAFPIVFWEWDFSDGNISNDQNAIHNYNTGGNYDVVLVIQDEHGCLDTTKRKVNIYLPPNVPSAFSPNGDGNNDMLYVYGGPYETLEFKIYNNWGEVIFKTNDAINGWDGTYKGVSQPVGVYVWTVKATTIDGEKHELSGDTSLIK